MNAPTRFAADPGTDPDDLEDDDDFFVPDDRPNPQARAFPEDYVRVSEGPRAQRHDGWTPERQRAFLEGIAEGMTVDIAAARVGLSATGAYALRRRAAGASFALGWSAANLLARERLAAALYARAFAGFVETVTRADGSSVMRHRYDNRLAATMLARLDRQAEDPGQGAAVAAARLVAQDFEAFLDVLERDQGPARAGLFLGNRAASEADMAPIVALARADRYCRAGAALAQEVDTADLDPTGRAQWTAEQWQRAEAAGIVALAPEPEPDETASASQLSQLHPDDEEDADGPVWWDEDAEAWRTSFPPPEGYRGYELGEYGDPDYSRTLSAAETAACDASYRADIAELAQGEAAIRDAFFAEHAAKGRAPVEPDDARHDAAEQAATGDAPDPG
jgi:hypothetical protein